MLPLPVVNSTVNKPSVLSFPSVSRVIVRVSPAANVELEFGSTNPV